MNIHTENQNFIVIKIENTSDIEPIVINGRLKTHKDNAKLHGIRMNSISRALSAYNGSLDWKYNKITKDIFHNDNNTKFNRLGKYTTA